MLRHDGFIVAAFMVTGTVLAAMIVAVFIDYGLQHRTLARLLAHSDRRGRA